jgi:hypothetical protein
MAGSNREVESMTQMVDAAQERPAAKFVDGVVNYTRPTGVRPRFHAVDHSRDNLALEPRAVRIEDARHAADAPRLDREGFGLVRHASAVRDWRNADDVKRINAPEVEQLVRELTGADHVACNSPGVLRWSEASPTSGTLVNSYPARFVHVDVSDPTGRAFAERASPRSMNGVRRYAHFNVWRALSPPPQDVPLAVCDARTVALADLMPADAIFDAPGAPEWSFEGLVVRANPHHRWVYWSNMSADEVIVFTTNDSDPALPHNVPHSAFNDPGCPKDAVPRASIEIRAIAFWFA